MSPMKLVLSWCTLLVLLDQASSFSMTSRTEARRSTRLCSKIRDSDGRDPFPPNSSSRRSVLLGTAGLSMASIFLVGGPTKALAASTEQEATAEATTGLVSAERVAQLLRAVPTFTLVDQKGVPFVVVGEDAKVTGYFFTEYDEARRILDLARKSADRLIADEKKDKLKEGVRIGPNELVNPWKEARVSTIPLDTAVSLATRSVSSTTRTNFQVAASENDIEEALKVTGKDDLAENLVPMFYYENFTLTGSDGNKQSPLYFRKSELEKAYRSSPQSRGDDSPPPVLVTELFATLREMVRPGGTNEDFKSLVFVAPAESAARAKECERKGGKEAPFLLGQRNVVL